MKKFSKNIGLDVHKETIAVAVADGVTSEVRFVMKPVLMVTAFIDSSLIWVGTASSLHAL